MRNPSIKFSSLILKPQNGSKVTTIFYSGLKISVSVGVLAAVGILAIKVRHLIEFNPLDQVIVSRRPRAVPGLENLGNNCFLNVVLQALSSCSSFRKYLAEMVGEYGSLSNEGDQDIPLVTSLASLVEELCTVHHKRIVLSPRKVMLAMDHYIPNFILTRQQDAEEAFSLLLSSLRDEISEHCIPVKSYLADLPSLHNGRLILRKRQDEESEWQRWKRSFLRPFDGILGSTLICQSCSFQISLDFQLFNSLHLSPPTSNDATIVGCTLEDWLTIFFAVERVENYFCSNCWHAAAIEYVSAFSEKTDIETLQRCNKDDSCECKALPSLPAFPWSNRFSRTFKQLSIARGPKILCIHLQRASYNMFGQTIKLLGHVSFPLMLDLSPFMHIGVGLKNMDSKLEVGALKLRSNEIRPFLYSKYQNMLINPRMQNRKANNVVSFSLKTDAVEGPERNPVMENGLCLESCDATPGLSISKGRDHGNADGILPSATTGGRPMYRLVSVVEHFGTSGSGHYVVYKKVTARLGEDEEAVGLLESAVEQWFRISDSEVHDVSERDVVGANASMLFYERIGNS